MGGLKEWLYKAIAKDDNDCGYINNACEKLVSNMVYTHDPTGKSEFLTQYKEFTEALNRDIIRKNSSLYSEGYMNRIKSAMEEARNMNDGYVNGNVGQNQNMNVINGGFSNAMLNGQQQQQDLYSRLQGNGYNGNLM